MKTQAQLVLAIVLATLAAISMQLIPVKAPTSSFVLASIGRHSPDSFIVTSTADTGPSTLRQALLDAQPGDAIIFDATVFPPAAPVTITLTTPLPMLTQGNLTLDGSSAGVVLDGSQLSGEDTHGLDISSDGNVVRGLEILNFPAAAVGLREGVSGNVVEDNLLSGNSSFGVGIWGAETTGNSIRSNIIGTDRSGLSAANLSRDGIHIYQAGQNTIIANLIGGVGQSGIYICCGSTGNTVSSNTIGVATDGNTPLPNGQAGITIDQGAHSTVVGPGNVIAHNPVGVNVIGADSVDNTITQNRIYSNTEGISLFEGGNGEPTPPSIIGFSLSAGNVEGVTCAHCTVEIFSTSDDQGDAYEDQTASDSVGYFTLDRDSAFYGPYLTATATDAAGNTSSFSRPTSGEQQIVDLQAGNVHPKALIPAHSASELAENKVGDMLSLYPIQTAEEAEDWVDWHREMGLKWAHLSLDDLDWYEGIPASTFEVDPLHDQLITDLVEGGVSINYLLIFWDGEITNETTPGYSRFQDPDEVERYLNYARFIVNHFKDRIKHYQILHETLYSEGGYGQQNIRLPDYVSLFEEAEQVIHEEDSEAVVVAGSAPALYDQACYNYQIDILSSQAMSAADGIAWHPGSYPLELGEHVDHLYRVPATVEELKQTAFAHGFAGDFYMCDGIVWPTVFNPSPSEPWNLYGERAAAKYFARGIVEHTAMDCVAITGGLACKGDFQKNDATRNLANLLAGVEASPLPLQVQSTLTDVVSYTFAYEDGDGLLIALWEDGFSTDETEPGTPLTLTVSDIATTLHLSSNSDLSVTGYDVLHNFRQPLDTYVDGDSLVIPNLQVCDYPLVVRLSQIIRAFLPIVLKD